LKKAFMDKKPDLKAEIDFKDLLRKPSKLFGYSYIYFIIILGGLGYLYVDNLTVIGKNAVSPVALKDSSVFIQDIPLQSARVIPPVDVMKASVSRPELVQRGKELFKANCASCHGDDGEGNGSASATLNPKPRNFHSLQGWTNGSKVSQIYKTLEEGIVKNGMASFSYLSPIDRFALIQYVRSFATGHPVDSPEELQSLETAYQLSKGSNTPGQIPVRVAERNFLTESELSVARIAEVGAIMGGRSGNSGEAIFVRVTGNRQKALTAVVLNASIRTIDQFVKVVSADPVQIGFRAEVVQLSPAQWTALFQYVNELRARKG
jgi:mono/diheme cytochrome c family protein